MLLHFSTHTLLLQDGKTLVYIASENDQPSIVDLLALKGANVNESSNGVWIPCHIACRKGNLEVVGVLLEFGCNLLLRGMVSSKRIRHVSYS